MSKTIDNISEETDTTKNNYSYDANITLQDAELNALDPNFGINMGTLYSLSDYYSIEDIKTFVQYPMTYHKQLMDISEKIYNRNGLYHQTISKMTSAPSLDYVVIPVSIDEKISKKTKRKIDNAYDICDNKMNHKLSTRDVLFNSYLYGEYVAIWRDTKTTYKRDTNFVQESDRIEGLSLDENMMLQPLDLRYVRFEGYMNGDYVVSYDMQYFDLFKGHSLVGEIKNYPKEFLLGYNAYKKDASKRWLILDQKTTFAYKFHGAINEAHGRPLCLSALQDILFSEDYTEAQRTNMYQNSSSISYMELPQGKEAGSCSLNSEQQKNQYNAFKNAVRVNESNQNRKMGRTTTLKLAPNTKIGTLKPSDTLIDSTKTLTEQNTTNVSTGLGMGASAFNAEGQASYSALQVNIDMMLSEVFVVLEQTSFQYTKLLNNYLDKGTTIKDRFKYQLRFEYLQTSTLNVDKQFARYKDLYTLAGGSRIYLYSCVSGNARTYLSLMDYERALDMDSKYPAHLTSFTSSQNDSLDAQNVDGNEGGRPSKSASELTDSGMATRNYGSNDMAKPNV